MIYFVSHHFNFGKNVKTHFQKEFVNDIWVIIGDYEYINIAEIKIVKPCFFFPPPPWDFSGKSYFPASPQMLIYAN